MKITKFSHSCVRFENQGKVLVMDPGSFSEVDQALTGADYLLITHAHPDHYDVQQVNAYVAEHPELVVYAPAAVADQIRAAAPTASVHSVAGEENFSLDGFDVETFGGQHALIHPLIKTIDNVGYLINSQVYHPGDSLIVPHGITPSVVLVPIHAPWNKIQEVIDFIISVGAPTAYPIHNALLSENGHKIIEGQLANFGKKYGTEYVHLNTGDSVEI